MIRKAAALVIIPLLFLNSCASIFHGTTETIHTTATILAEPHVGARGTVARKKRFIAIIAVDTVVAQLAILAIDHIETLLAVMECNAIRAIFQISAIKTKITVFRITRHAVIRVYRRSPLEIPRNHMKKFSHLLKEGF